MMKKLLVFALALILALSLTACDNGNDNDIQDSSDNDTDIRVRTGNDDDDADETSDDSADTQEQPDTPDDASDLLVGTWVYTVDLSSLLQDELAELAELGEDFAGLFDDLGSNAMLTMLFEFNADGTFRMYADEDSVYTMISTVIERIMPALDYLIDAVYEELAEAAEALDMSVEDLIAAFEEEEGISFSDYMDILMEEMLSEMSDFEMLFEDFTDSGSYKIEGDRLFVASAGEEFDYYNVFEISGNTLTLLSTSDPNYDPDEFGGLFSYPVELTRR